MRLWITLFSLLMCCSGCFRRFVQSDKQLQAYFRSKTAKPVYFTIKNDSVSLFCAVTGADTLPPLLIVHGAPGAWYGSRNLMIDSAILSKFQVIAVDRLGYDKSRFKNSRRAVTSISLQSTAIFEAMRLNRSRQKGIVMGSSYGGPIAVKIALNHPESFYHVLLLAAAADPANEKFWWFHRYIKHGPIKWLLPRFMRSATNEKFAHVKELKELLPQWKNLAVPVTALQGDADHIVPPANLDFLKQELAGKPAKFILLPGTDHLIRWQKADLVRQIILSAGN